MGSTIVFTETLQTVYKVIMFFEAFPISNGVNLFFY